MTKSGDTPAGEIFFEFTKIGAQMRVAALHAASGTEVVVIAPLTATRQQMQQVALNKLKMRMKREAAAR